MGDSVAGPQARAAALRREASRLRREARAETEAARQDAENRAGRFLDQQTALAASAGPVAAANEYSTQNANLHRGGQPRGAVVGEPPAARRQRKLADSLDAEAARLSAAPRSPAAGR